MTTTSSNANRLDAERPGSMIVVEGPDGVGKSTAVRELFLRLQDKGIDVVQTRNVGGTRLAEAIRAITLDASIPLDPVQQNMLIAAARRSNLIEVVIPAMDRGAVVLCDRFVSSAIALQTTNREGGYSITDRDVIDMHEAACDGFVPDLTIHLHASAEIRLARRTARNEGHDRFDNGDLSYDAAIAAKYGDAGRILGHPSVDVDAGGTMDETVSRMMSAIEPIVTGMEICVLAYRVSRDRSGKWHPVTVGSKTFRTFDSHAANEMRCRMLKDGCETRLTSRAVAVKCMDGVTTSQLNVLDRIHNGKGRAFAS